MTKRSTLPHPLFCTPCPAAPDRMVECPGFQPATSGDSYRQLVRCRYFVVEVTDAGPIPGCIRPHAAVGSRRIAAKQIRSDTSVAPRGASEYL
jgi:hypothetical protein